MNGVSCDSSRICWSEEGNLVHRAFYAESEPVNLEATLKDRKWSSAMNEELNFIESNKTWELVDLPRGKKEIGVKWVYKVKLNSKGEVTRHKARLAVKGFVQGGEDEEMYVAQPPSFSVKGQESKVYKLRKALYGLKQDPRAWNKIIDKFLIDWIE
ncbi:copia-type polyprotein [Trifolium medium]|uniref:Copia-type polyprotein n=1 Tax=Trifolium medium TaxID=97028 RepID=A0A392M2M4_9FABA|nr:copia-type polyprotein [Trifolium medium]